MKLNFILKMTLTYSLVQCCKTLNGQITKRSVKAKVAVDKVKQVRKTLFKVIVIGEREFPRQNPFQLNSAETQVG